MNRRENTRSMRYRALRSRTLAVPALVSATVALSALLALLAACGGGDSKPPPPPPPSPPRFAITGSVMGGLQPVAGAAVVAYAVGMSAGATPIEIGAATSDSGGVYQISFTTDPNEGDLVYLSASGGGVGQGENDAIGLMTVAGPWCYKGVAGCSFPRSNLIVNELGTAVATAVFHRYIQFVDCQTISGNNQTGTCVVITGAAGLAGTARTLGNLLNVANAGPSDFLTAQPDETSIHLTLERMNTIASILAGCVEADVTATPNACVDLLGEVGNGATDTLDAAWLIASNSTVNADGAGLFALLSDAPVFTPVLDAAPASWTIGGQRFAFTSNAAGSVSAYRIDDATAGLIPVTTGGAANCYGPNGPPFDPKNCFPAAIAPAAIVASPNGRFVFVANCEGPPDNISAYAIDPGTGALVEIEGSPFLGGPHPFSVKVDASGSHLYVAQIGPSDGVGPAPRPGFVGVYSIDPVSGVLTEVAGSPFEAGDSTYALALDSQGRYVFATNHGPDSAARGSVAAFSIDSASGALTPVAGFDSCGEAMSDACFAGGQQIWKITTDASGKFVYAVNFVADSISAWSIGSDGSLATVAGTASCGVGLPATCFAAGDYPGGIISHPTAPYIFVTNSGFNQDHSGGPPGQGSIQTFRVDTNTGALTLVATFDTDNAPLWGTVDKAGEYLYVANFKSTHQEQASRKQGTRAMSVNNISVSVYAIDTETGTLTEIGGSPFFAGPAADAVAVTP